MGFLDIFYPKRCLVCGKPGAGSGSVGTIEYICLKCVDKVEFVGDDICTKCAKPECRCRKRNFYFDCAIAPFVYTGAISDSVVRLKEYSDFSTAQGFAHYMAVMLKKLVDTSEIDVIVPVPAHISRKSKKGYNQSEIIARYLSKLTGIPFDKKILKKIKPTMPQRNLNGEARRHNLTGSFAASEKAARGKNIILADDVITTGETLNCCAQELKRAGAGRIYCIAAVTTK
ncbi:MAG: ComF family protein [Oscillospiraceae bacterium]|nr:ComF family protein [Oscillospiraceae bacterium]